MLHATVQRMAELIGDCLGIPTPDPDDNIFLACADAARGEFSEILEENR